MRRREYGIISRFFRARITDGAGYASIGKTKTPAGMPALPRSRFG